MPLTVSEDADFANARCTINTYQAPTAPAYPYFTWIADRVTETRLRDTDCATGTSRSRATFGYDSFGNNNATTRFWDVTGGQGYSSSSAYDAYGRVTSMTDMLGRTSSAQYVAVNAWSGWPSQVIITTPIPAAGGTAQGAVR